MSNENHDPEDDDDLSFSLPRAEDEWVDHVALIRRDHLRLDQFLQTLLPDITRSMAQKLIDDGRIHPVQIKKYVEKAKEQVEDRIREHLKDRGQEMLDAVQGEGFRGIDEMGKRVYAELSAVDATIDEKAVREAKAISQKELDDSVSAEAVADAEVDRRVDLGIVELHQHVVAGHAEVGGAERHEGGDVEGADADDVEVAMVGREAQQARVGIGEGGFRLDAGARQQGRRFLQDAALRQGQDQFFVRFAHDMLQ